MAKVTGIGGFFFKSKDPAALSAWYVKHLGIGSEAWAGHIFKWDEQLKAHSGGYTIWSAFNNDTTYFTPSEKPFMINLTVNNLYELLDQLRKAGVTVDDKTEESEYGKFGWIMDPEGNRIELWEPATS